MIDRCYLEITNVCNLDCVFCPKTGRRAQRLTVEEFEWLTDRLQGEVKFLYFHLMGEPTMNPELPRFIERARAKGFIPVLTTNGTLLGRCTGLVEARPHKVQISLHSHEGNGKEQPAEYIREVMTYALAAAEAGTIVVLRLWNQGGLDSENEQLMALLCQYVPQPWTERYDGYRLAERLYLEFDHKFDWPDQDAEEHRGEEVFCYALRNQVGVLVDGSVVPCCLDHDGAMTLGNLHRQSLAEVLASPRARRLYDGFSQHRASEALCRRCGYANVTKRFRKN